MKPVFDAEHDNRQSTRMKGYDYTLPGAYFVTIISQNRMCLFGDIEKGEVKLSKIGQLVISCWKGITDKINNIVFDEFVLMPNHLHGIIFILESDGKGEAFSDLNTSMCVLSSENASPLRPRGTQSGSLSAVIQNFKSVSTRMMNKRYFKPGNKIWQRNYYERIIRNDRELNAIRQYIHNNPLNWVRDLENPTDVRIAIWKLL